MAFIKAKGPGKWLMRWRAVDAATGRTVERAKLFAGGRADALRAAHEAEAAQRREPVTGSRGLTLAQFLADWQAWRSTAGNVAQKTSHRDAQHIKLKFNSPNHSHES
jgi:hypothetical protein